jgi:rhomboid protease GluP
MYALYLVGQSLEPPYGHIRFLGLYVLAGFCGNVFSTLFSPYPSLGSSTAIFGLIAAQGVFVLKNREYFGSRAQRILINIAMIAAINFIIGLSPGIDNWGHLGGFLGGAFMAWFVGPTLHGQVVQTGEGLALILEDERSTSDQLIAGLAVTCILVGLSAWAIFLR